MYTLSGTRKRPGRVFNRFHDLFLFRFHATFFSGSMFARLGYFRRFFNVSMFVERRSAKSPPDRGRVMGVARPNVFCAFPNRFRAVSIKPPGPLHPPASAGHHAGGQPRPRVHHRRRAGALMTSSSGYRCWAFIPGRGLVN